jgi:DNA-binding NarL/FixJ family response regulator
MVEGGFGRPRIRCMIVDGHALLREGVRRLLEDEPDIEVVDGPGGLTDALPRMSQERPDVVLVDTMSRSGSSADTVRLVQHACPGAKLLFLTGRDDQDSPVQGLQAGAMGYVHKDSSGASLVQALRDAHRGIRYVSPQVLQQVRRDRGGLGTLGKPLGATLTPREREVVKLIAEGHSVKSIAVLLKVSAKTVDAHKFNLMRKLGIHNKAQLVTYAIQQRIIKLPMGA